jgi:hypothetical protein
VMCLLIFSLFLYEKQCDVYFQKEEKLILRSSLHKTTVADNFCVLFNYELDQFWKCFSF